MSTIPHLNLVIQQGDLARGRTPHVTDGREAVAQVLPDAAVKRQSTVGKSRKAEKVRDRDARKPDPEVPVERGGQPESEGEPRLSPDEKVGSLINTRA